MICWVNCELCCQKHQKPLKTPNKKHQNPQITTTSTNQTTPKYHQSNPQDTLMQKLCGMLGQL